ncbi:hypothetical protein NL676_039872 [Syzygium grande]|nr:hypothetical protein NL676_039872 [Syzygium grande]
MNRNHNVFQPKSLFSTHAETIHTSSVTFPVVLLFLAKVPKERKDPKNGEINGPPLSHQHIISSPSSAHNSERSVEARFFILGTSPGVHSAAQDAPPAIPSRFSSNVIQRSALKPPPSLFPQPSFCKSHASSG